MTATSREFLDAFDKLAPEERQAVAAEILRRSTGLGELSDEGLEAMAAEVFAVYEGEESESGDQ